MVFIILVWERELILKQIYTQLYRTSNTVTLRHDGLYPLLRIISESFENSSSGVNASLLRLRYSFQMWYHSPSLTGRVRLVVKLCFHNRMGREGRASPDSGGLLALQTSPIRLMC